MGAGAGGKERSKGEQRGGGEGFSLTNNHAASGRGSFWLAFFS